jgi:Mg-chelatase subunit ChlD
VGGRAIGASLALALCAACAPSLPQGAAAPPAAPEPIPAPFRSVASAVASVWLDVEQPTREAPAVRMEWLEVRGFAGSRQQRAYDVAIAVDVSGSTRYASGADVDGNGLVGVRREVKPWEVWSPLFDCSDPGDSVLYAELAAVAELVERLDPRRTRIALISFAERARVRAPLGATREQLSRVIEELDGDFGAGATDLAQATRLAMRVLVEGAGSGPSPERVLLVLSDGDPNVPPPEERAAALDVPPPEERAAALALEAAGEAAAAQVRISTFALGPGVRREPDVYARMAARSGGEHVRVATAGDVLHALPRIDLARVAGVAVDNLTTGESARALRVRPDGAFDAWVRLAPGANRLRVRARGPEGDEVSEERQVRFDDRLPPDPEALARAREAIALRTLELELEREARAGRQRKRLEVTPAPDPAD